MDYSQWLGAVFTSPQRERESSTVSPAAGRYSKVQAPEPRDFTNAAWMSKQTDRYLFSVISGGKPHTAMLGHADLFTPLQRALLVQYVRYFAEPAERQRLEEGLP